MKRFRYLLTALLILFIVLYKIPSSLPVGVGVNPSSLSYAVASSSMVSKELWVINTGDVRAQYDLFFDSQYEAMFRFSHNGFELDPDMSQKVTVSYDPSRNPQRHDLNTYLHIKGKQVGAIIETGIRIPVTVIHESIASSTSTANGHGFPLKPTDAEILNALGYLSAQQGSDGSISGFGTSCWAAMAIASAGYNPNDWKKGGPSLIDYIINNRSQIDQNKVTDLSKFILALTAANKDPQAVSGINYVSILESKSVNGQFGDDAICNDDFWAILALVSVGKSPTSPIIQDSVAFIKSRQNSDGGWSWHSGSSDVDNTAAAIMALRAAGEAPQSSIIANAINYLKNQLHVNGGFSFMGEANSASDAWAIMALVSCNINPLGSEWVRNSISPVDHLLNLQNLDGSFSWKSGEAGNSWWTSYAIPALLGKPYPVKGEFSLQYTTTATTTNSPRTTSYIPAPSGSTQVYLRIEDVDKTVWRGWLDMPSSTIIECFNSGKTYTIPGDNVLAVLDKAAEDHGFTYRVSDQWYPDIGFYITSIGGHEAEGEYGWIYRVNYVPCNVAVNNFQIRPQDEILLYWGTADTKPLKVEVDRVEVDVGGSVTATVKYRNDQTGEWLPLSGATVHVNDDYSTDQEGKAIINLTEQKVYSLYAEKWGAAPGDQYVRSDIVQVGSGVPITEFSSRIPIVAALLLLSLLTVFSKRGGRCIR